jgi:hypothetical protein
LAASWIDHPKASPPQGPAVPAVLQVTHLNVSMNPIGDAGAKHLAALLVETPLPLARHLMW